MSRCFSLAFVRILFTVITDVPSSPLLPSPHSPLLRVPLTHNPVSAPPPSPSNLRNPLHLAPTTPRTPQHQLTNLFCVLPPVRFAQLRWLAAALACVTATTAMKITGYPTRPPARPCCSPAVSKPSTRWGGTSCPSCGCRPPLRLRLHWPSLNSEIITVLFWLGACGMLECTYSGITREHGGPTRGRSGTRRDAAEEDCAARATFVSHASPYRNLSGQKSTARARLRSFSFHLPVTSVLPPLLAP